VLLCGTATGCASSLPNSRLVNCLPGLGSSTAPACAPACPAPLPLQVDIREAEARAARSEREREATERSMAAELEELQAALQVGAGRGAALRGLLGWVGGYGGRAACKFCFSDGGRCGVMR
jgi:hypothetical protein